MKKAAATLPRRGRAIFTIMVSTLLCAAWSSAFEFAFPDPRRCSFASSVEIFGISFFLFSKRFRFLAPFSVFSVFDIAFRFLFVCVAICLVSFCRLFCRIARCFFQFHSAFFRCPLPGNLDILLVETRAPSARERDGGDRVAGKTAKPR